VQHGLAGSPGDVTLRLRRTGRRVIAEVSDDGVGLPPGFDPAESTGLGLRIVRALVAEELSGAVTWEPNIPHGTTVVVDSILLT
ncbi:MAG: ATP-binding protein, partial [Actinomycetes bacterium]